MKKEQNKNAVVSVVRGRATSFRDIVNRTRAVPTEFVFVEGLDHDTALAVRDGLQRACEANADVFVTLGQARNGRSWYVEVENRGANVRGLAEFHKPVAFSFGAR